MFEFIGYKTKKIKGKTVSDISLEDYLQKGLKKAKDDEEARRMEIEEIRLSSFIGQPVIVISNEVSNPMVGIAKEVTHITLANVPMLVVEDVVTGQNYVVFGTVFAYTEQKFDALNNMDPQARIALFYYRESYYNVEKEAQHELATPEEWAQIVKTALASVKTKRMKP